MAYIKNAELTRADVQRLLAKWLPDYRDITTTHQGYAFLVECVAGWYAGEIVGFRELSHARRWMVNERKSREEGML